MSIDPVRLRDASQLLFGTALDADESEALARTLGVVEEVLPWMVLRREALVKFPELEAAVKAASAICPSPASRRPLPHDHPTQATLNTIHAIEEALGAVIAENVKNSGLSAAVDHHLAELVRVSPSGNRFDGQNRIFIDREAL